MQILAIIAIGSGCTAKAVTNSLPAGRRHPLKLKTPQIIDHAGFMI